MNIGTADGDVVFIKSSKDVQQKYCVCVGISDEMGWVGCLALISREFNSGEGNCIMGGVGWGGVKVRGERAGVETCVCV